MSAELRGLICSGPMRGAQHTYAVLDERVPPGLTHDEDEALTEIDKRYVTLGEHQLQPHDLLSLFLIRHGHPTSITSHTTRSTRRARSGT